MFFSKKKIKTHNRLVLNRNDMYTLLFALGA